MQGGDFDSLSGIVSRLHDIAEERDQLHAGDLVEMIGTRTFGPLMVVPALIAILPIVGAIPGMTIVTGLLITLVAFQIVAGRKHAWVPDRVREIPIQRSALKRGADAFAPVAKRVDSFTAHRWKWATHGMGLWLTAMVLVLLGLLMIPTALIPWGVMVPGTAALVLALGITVRDGLIVVIGWVCALAAVIGTYVMLA